MIYKFTISPKGAVGTPFRSDTLFGHSCWSILFSEGEESMEGFLQKAREQKPSLVFSNGFPKGYLPKPLFPVPTFEGRSPKEQKKIKSYYKSKWVKIDTAEKENWNLTYKDSLLESVSSDMPKPNVIMHNVIDRITGTSLDKNGLFAVNHYYYENIWENIDIYVSTEWKQDILTDFIINLFKNGYGKDHSIGSGVIDLKEEPKPVSFKSQDNSDLYLSLSVSVPDEKIDLKESFYELEPKYGKIWFGMLDMKPEKCNNNPFKKTILQTVPGSVFKINKHCETAGTVLDNIHDNTDIVENCKTILYPLPKGAGYDV